MMPALQSALAPQHRVGMALLDDRRETAPVEREAAVARRVGRPKAQHRDRGIVRAPRREQLGQRVGGDQRRVAVQHQHLALLRQLPARRHQRVPGAELRRLMHDRRRQRPAVDLGRDRVHAGREDHQRARRRERGCGVQHVADQRPPGERMQDLRPVGLHARALARGEQDHGERCGHRHRTLQRSRPVANGDSLMVKNCCVFNAGHRPGKARSQRRDAAVRRRGVRPRRHAGRHRARSLRPSQRDAGRARPPGARARRDPPDDRRRRAGAAARAASRPRAGCRRAPTSTPCSSSS